MKPEHGWLTPNTPVETILKVRPMAMSLFEGARVNPWKSLRDTFDHLCLEKSLNRAECVRKLENLPMPSPGTDWRVFPVYHLLDFIIGQHRDFLHGYLPAVGRILSEVPETDGKSLIHLRSLATEWPAFAKSLANHLAEEESVFLRILRYDSAFRLETVEPEFEGGSVRVFTAVRMLEHEHRDLALFRKFLDRAMPEHPGREGDELEARLRPLLDDFQRDLGQHGRLETEVLFPWGIRLERSLYDLHIRG